MENPLGFHLIAAFINREASKALEDGLMPSIAGLNFSISVIQGHMEGATFMNRNLSFHTFDLDGS